MSKASKAKVEANARWDAKAYDKYLVRLPKGQKATVQAAAEAEGESLNSFTNKALLARMELDEWPEDTNAASVIDANEEAK